MEDVLLATNNVLTLVLNSDSSATQYTISYHSTTCQEVGTTVVTIPASQTHYSMTVCSGQAYDITVTAHNQIGTSEPEKMVYIVHVYAGKQISILVKLAVILPTLCLPAPDGLPANVSLAVVNSTAVHVTWRHVSCVSSNGAIVSYLVVYTGAVGGGKTLTVPSTESSTVITNLDPQSQYSVRVAVRNEKGNGPFSDPLYTSTPTGTCTLHHVSNIPHLLDCCRSSTIVNMCCKQPNISDACLVHCTIFIQSVNVSSHIHAYTKLQLVFSSHGCKKGGNCFPELCCHRQLKSTDMLRIWC